MCTLNCIHEFIRKPHHVCHYIDFLLVEMDTPLYTHDARLHSYYCAQGYSYKKGPVKLNHLVQEVIGIYAV